jgi:hypothetical protein
LLNFQFDPAACAVALGWPGATVEDTAVHLTPDGAVARDPAGHPVRLLTDLDGAAFNSHWLDTIECLTSARRPADRVRDHRVRADPGRHQREGRGCDLAVGALVFLYFLLTGRSRELTIGEGA